LFISFTQLSKAQSIAFKSSEVHDAIVFLQVINDSTNQDTIVNEEAKYWRVIFNQTERGKEVLEKLSGRGIAFVYLFSHSNFTDLKSLQAFLENTHTMDFAPYLYIQMDEPAYLSAFRLLVREKALFKDYIEILIANRFTERINGHFNQSTVELDKKGKEITSNWDLNKLQNSLGFWTPNTVVYKDSIIVMMSSFSGGYAYQLKGKKLGIPPGYINADDLNYLITHEIAHKFNPSAEILRHLILLKGKDAFYNEVHQRIHNDFKEGLEEEFVMALGLLISYESGRLSENQCWSILKCSFHQSKMNKGTAIAAIVFNRLLHVDKNAVENFDLHIFLRDSILPILKPNTIKEQYIDAVKNIDGLIGLKLTTNNTIDFMYKNYPAKNYGLKKGDVILKVNEINVSSKDYSETLWELRGYKGEVMNIVVKRRNKEKVFKVVLM